MQTNANSSLIASLLADARVGTFTGLITTKKGVERGRGADKKVYGNDTVHAVIFTGFRYDNLIRRSLDALEAVKVTEVIADCAKKGFVVTQADVEQALAELQESCQKSLAGENVSTTDHVYDPLVVNGETVRGARVYKCVAGQSDENGKPYECHCRNCTGDARAPLPGTIYLTGLRVWSEVIVPAPNGPAPASTPKTMVSAAKQVIERKLPKSKFAQYVLEPGTDFILRAGGTAAVEATKAGFTVTDDIVDVLAKAS